MNSSMIGHRDMIEKKKEKKKKRERERERERERPQPKSSRILNCLSVSLPISHRASQRATNDTRARSSPLSFPHHQDLRPPHQSRYLLTHTSTIVCHTHSIISNLRRKYTALFTHRALPRTVQPRMIFDSHQLHQSHLNIDHIQHHPFISHTIRHSASTIFERHAKALETLCSKYRVPRIATRLILVSNKPP